MKQTQTTKRFFYGWVIVFFSTLALAVSNGLTTLGFPVFHRSIRDDFVASGAVAAGEAQSFIANGASLTFLVAGFFSPVAGFLIQKFSLRALMTAGCLLLGAGLLLHAQSETPTLVYLARILMGMSLGFVGVLANTVLVSNWFRRLRGTAMGIVLTGTSLGGFAVPLIATPLITGYGWRAALVFVSLLVWLVLLPAVLLLVKNKPSEMGMFPDGENTANDATGKTNGQTIETGMTLGEALLTPKFWIFSLCAALIFYAIFAVSQQLNLYLQGAKIGFTPQQAGFVQSLLFALSIAGKFLYGFLSDKFSTARVMLVSALTMFLSTLTFLYFDDRTVYLFVILFGLNYGGTFVLLQLLVADYFGLREYGKILGAVTMIETLGAAIGGKITGYLADRAGGDYTQAFYAVMAAAGAAFVLVLLLNLMPQKSAEADRSAA